MPLRISLTSKFRPIYPHAQNKARNNVVNAKFYEKSHETVNKQIREKSVDRKAHRPALTNEVRSRRSRGIFCRKDFCTNFLNTQYICDFCINSALTKFLLALFVQPTFVKYIYFFLILFYSFIYERIFSNCIRIL